ncbi:hypothetical protein ANOM_003229 [Aspergillus nomiae NRRL 13137]|uniref:Uncharacterized protein n=1 Tax=Aspergillus nomiae NRRL (strain ATCC 15546 / NRRL 13137 / CBS 260.88 / M93) TaxID=1509407 RepID=A0A0L1J9U5_ASPN3|nr:uncharacterized protein ANOM_003229 [Aspergillus nomiae NRRL 13137]KNG88514.1 hypothetical protein ANOM_003229 [Aspergillus nomiae NRRL 13137]
MIGWLSPTEHLSLNHFVAAAVDSEIAARYFISRRTGVQQDVEIKREWRLVERHFYPLNTFRIYEKSL